MANFPARFDKGGQNKISFFESTLTLFSIEVTCRYEKKISYGTLIVEKYIEKFLQILQRWDGGVMKKKSRRLQYMQYSCTGKDMNSKMCCVVKFRATSVDILS